MSGVKTNGDWKIKMDIFVLFQLNFHFIIRPKIAYQMKWQQEVESMVRSRIL